MGYQEFKKAILSELKDFYGKDAAAITVKDMKDDEGRHCEGIIISMQDSDSRECYGVNLNVLYIKYASGDMDIYDCVETIYREREGKEASEKCQYIEKDINGGDV